MLSPFEFWKYSKALALDQCFIAFAIASLLINTPRCLAENDDDFFETRVRPVLVKHCLECHGAKKQEGGLRLDSRDGWMRGGDRGEAILAGEPSKSLLIQAVRYDDPDLQMPPGNKKLSRARSQISKRGSSAVRLTLDANPPLRLRNE